MRRARTSSLGLETPQTSFATMPKRAMPSTLRFSPRRRNSATTRAQAQFAGLRSECLFGIEEDGDRAFIDELHGHHSLKDSGGDGDTEAAKRFAEFCVKLLREFRRRCGNEAGATLAARVAIKRELRDDERSAF